MEGLTTRSCLDPPAPSTFGRAPQLERKPLVFPFSACFFEPFSVPVVRVEEDGRPPRGAAGLPTGGPRGGWRWTSEEAQEALLAQPIASAPSPSPGFSARAEPPPPPTATAAAARQPCRSTQRPSPARRTLWPPASGGTSRSAPRCWACSLTYSRRCCLPQAASASRLGPGSQAAARSRGRAPPAPPPAPRLCPARRWSFSTTASELPQGGAATKGHSLGRSGVPPPPLISAPSAPFSLPS